MYIIVKGEFYYVDRVYWFYSGSYAVYEFTNSEGDMFSVNVAPHERLEDKVEIYYEED
jgi:hypothetical protein